MKPLNILAGVAAVLTVPSLSGCFIAADVGGGYHNYRNDRGDLVIDNQVRYVAWCDTHPQDIHCKSAARVASGQP